LISKSFKEEELSSMSKI